MGLSAISKKIIWKTEMEYLGFRVSMTGIQPINKIVEAILKVTTPKNTKEVHAFIGIVNYYSDIWTIWSHLLHLLTSVTSPKTKFKWTDVKKNDFDDIKHTFAHNPVLAYLDFNKRFDIHTYVIYYQLGAVIVQNGKSIAFYILKLNGVQM